MDGTASGKIAVSPPLVQLDLLIGFALAEDHGKREQEEDDSPRDLKRCEWNVHGSKDDFPRDNEENQDNRRYQGRFYCDF